MFFQITTTANTARYVRTKSNAEAELMDAALLQLRKLKKIKSYERIEFEMMQADDMLVT